ncbi:hypothetical protein K458DRAFT_387371 [Lentithecium fluviatile CBS 122367]|uniref:Uncharacterized protein n=1 Tax=Lentithecium fluviatile CBS 122367 TaxID=1168545 RepID=A0A6G1J764_9PLEO|nr:hypothetical protein K458DRAFT_387371 [Lentithecium fluviatile CBS 122367]
MSGTDPEWRPLSRTTRGPTPRHVTARVRAALVLSAASKPASVAALDARPRSNTASQRGPVANGTEIAWAESATRECIGLAVGRPPHAGGGGSDGVVIGGLTLWDAEMTWWGDTLVTLGGAETERRPACISLHPPSSLGRDFDYSHDFSQSTTHHIESYLNILNNAAV